MNELDESYWHYFLMLESDFNATIRFVDLAEKNDSTFSIELSRQIICSCTEFETVAKKLCDLIAPTKPAGNISQYKEIILSKYPDLPRVPVYIDRYKRIIFPFSAWGANGERLEWWDAYQHVKHHRHQNFEEANVKNTLSALSALLILAGW
ncbi:hypothetical protein [Methylomonas sp. DH-1]|uniref:hypothetical protein n=1 Tax=Methylomonas sp. (strain DH-1) TaxID=1727196 RepID=UPI0012F6B066|nr:hypothetical protein [Methylomonas sp. DH-1]